MGFEHVLENIMCIIVPHFLGQQLYKNADLCNCWPFFKQTITNEGAFVIFLFFEGENNKETGIHVIFGPFFLEK
jgi:hypothetical protein